MKMGYSEFPQPGLQRMRERYCPQMKGPGFWKAWHNHLANHQNLYEEEIRFHCDIPPRFWRLLQKLKFPKLPKTSLAIFFFLSQRTEGHIILKISMHYIQKLLLFEFCSHFINLSPKYSSVFHDLNATSSIYKFQFYMSKNYTERRERSGKTLKISLKEIII